jgi:hypothetical protein
MIEQANPSAGPYSPVVDERSGDEVELSEHLVVCHDCSPTGELRWRSIS